MIFSTALFLFFFIVVFLVQWFLIPQLLPERYRLRSLHLFLLVASYIFYMSWDWRFAFLILFSTLVDFAAGLFLDHRRTQIDSLRELEGRNDTELAERIERLNKERFYVLIASLLCNLGVLAYFKYADFFIGSFIDLINLLAPETFLPEARDSLLLKVILPLGISFFTFQSMSYTIDLWRGIIPAERSFLRFALFVSFFPQLVAGPIVVAKEFLPQLQRYPEFLPEKMREGVRWFALGYFKKVVIADNIAPLVDMVYANPAAYDATTLWLAAIGFWIQIYCDFSGYTDMAWGTAMLLGFHLPVNFQLPYLSRSLSELWQRWHISLIRWIRDYLYIPLGGSRVSFWRHKLNIFLTMFLSGLWHGAAWTFVIWGAIYGMLLALEHTVRSLPAFKRWSAFLDEERPIARWGGRAWTIFTFCYTTFMTIYLTTIFRSQNLNDSILILQRMIGLGGEALYNGAALIAMSLDEARPILLGVVAIYIGHAIGWRLFELKRSYTPPLWLELALAPLLILLLSQIGAQDVNAFIYFVF